MRLIKDLLIAAGTLLLFSHWIPGFEWVLYRDIVLSPGAYPTSVIWNFDKPLAGLLLLWLGIERPSKQDPWQRWVPKALGISVVCVGLLAGGALALHAIAWAPKWSRPVELFALGNLFLVCIPEELFFRGFVQGKLKSVGWASLFFGLCHFQGGLGLMVVATVAGFFYGTAYQKTGRLEASILVHFLLNFIHLTLFTYPALKP